MVVYRIAKDRYISDLSGAGARLNGGRWNHAGVAMVYTSPSRALATVEYLVHCPFGIAPKNLRIATVEIPGDFVSNQVEAPDLPEKWRHFPAPPELVDTGSHWALSNQSLALRMPSAAVDHEYNILLNPIHPDMEQVKIVEIQPYTFADRLVRAT